MDFKAHTVDHDSDGDLEQVEDDQVALNQLN